MSETATSRLVLRAPVVAWDGPRLILRCALGDVTSLEVTLHGSRDLLGRIEPRIEPFLPMALLAAGAARADLDVEAPVDRTYLSSLQLGYMPMLQRLGLDQ